MARFIMILVLGAIITYGVTSITLNEYTSQGTQNSMDDYSYNRARDIANGMTDIILMRIANDESYRVNSPITENLNGGYATYTAENSFIDGDSLIKITVSANYGGTAKIITAYAKPPLTLELDLGIHCLTANSTVKVNGSFLIDARNHTDGGVLIPQDGTYAMWSTGNINTGGGFKGGGTFNNVDYVPKNPPNSSIIASNQIYPGGFPTTPEQVFSNYPPGTTLKEFAQTGENGSQYVTDPELLSYPLEGVTYVDLPGGQEWTSAELSGNGIIVVHNNVLNARLGVPHGTFSGLIICDRIRLFKADVIGAVVSLTTTQSGGNIIGNTGSIIYSKEAIKNETKKFKLFNYGFGKKRLYIKHWNE